jgi:hypothetical protein
VARRLDAQAGGWWHTVAKPLLQNHNAAIVVALKVFMVSLRLHEQRSSETLVDSEPSIPAQFILAETIHQVSDSDDCPILRSASPNNMHQACSQLLYGLRVSFLACMVQAHLTNDRDLQDFLPSAAVLSTCQAVLEIGNLARVAKSYEGKVETGNPSPIPIVTEEWTAGLVFPIQKP